MSHPTPNTPAEHPASLPVWARSGDVPQRSVLGVVISSGCRRVSAALVSVLGRGLECRPHVVGHLVEPLGGEVESLYRNICNGRETHPGAPSTLANHLAAAAANVVQRLASRSGDAADRALAIGVYDPGLWDLTTGRRAYAGLCDAAQLADTTGYPVIEGFASRDLAQGGLGGPLLGLPIWMLMRRSDRAAAFLDIGRTVRLTYVPQFEARAANRVLSFDVGPGTSLLDRLAEQLTYGEHTFDPGGKLAVQGRQIPDLVEHWLKDPYFERPLPRWHPLGCRHEQELTETVRMAIDAGWSVRDLLCTACHFIAETTARAIRHRLPADDARELIVAGGGQQNGMLLGSLASRLSGWRISRAVDLGLADAAIDPAAAALLAMLHVDHTPANPMSLTGASSPRVLGRLSPGSPSRWHRLLSEMAAHRPAMMSLRSAV
ncbi:MAG: anhydro-N-acetylmuramic acid kinase [Pirellulales bacterium]